MIPCSQNHTVIVFVFLGCIQLIWQRNQRWSRNYIGSKVYDIERWMGRQHVVSYVQTVVYVMLSSKMFLDTGTKNSQYEWQGQSGKLSRAFARDVILLFKDTFHFWDKNKPATSGLTIPAANDSDLILTYAWLKSKKTIHRRLFSGYQCLLFPLGSTGPVQLSTVNSSRMRKCLLICFPRDDFNIVLYKAS